MHRYPYTTAGVGSACVPVAGRLKKLRHAPLPWPCVRYRQQNLCPSNGRHQPEEGYITPRDEKITFCLWFGRLAPPILYILRLLSLFNTSFTPRSRVQPKILNMGQFQVGPGIRPRLYRNKYAVFLQVDLDWASVYTGTTQVLSRVHLHRFKNRDWNGFNLVQYPGWIAESANPGYYFVEFRKRGGEPLSKDGL